MDVVTGNSRRDDRRPVDPTGRRSEIVPDSGPITTVIPARKVALRVAVLLVPGWHLGKSHTVVISGLYPVVRWVSCARLLSVKLPTRAAIPK